MRRGGIKCLPLLLAMIVPALADAQTCQFIGDRTIKRLWLEVNLGLVIVPTQNFDNAAGCANTSQAIVPASNPMFKNILAGAMMAMATGTPINAFGCGCQSAWNTNFPSVYNFGVGGTPL